jgi:hypothetical protein
MYVALGDRIADVMRSHGCRQAVGQQTADLQQVYVQPAPAMLDVAQATWSLSY